MIFEKKYSKLKIVTPIAINILKNHQRKLDKRRNILFNRADSWRRGMYFKNVFTKNSFSWVFKDRFSLFLFSPKSVCDKSLVTTYAISSFLININDLLVMFKTTFVALFYKNFIFYFPINIPMRFNNSLLIFFNKSMSSLEIHNSLLFWLNFWLIALVKKWFFKVTKNSYSHIFLKLKYKGKNYRWHRRKRGLVLRFGHSHLIYMRKPISVFLKKKGRMRIIFFGTNIELMYFFLKNIILWKPANVYTGRGLRLSRQRLLKKAGKVSAYR